MESSGLPTANNQKETRPEGKNIFLNILSPCPEVPQKLTYPDISSSTTIQELKQRIQSDVETRPSPERQRLIYRGRALVQGDRKLEEIFGREAIESSDVFSLHLVLPPVPNSSSSSVPNTLQRQVLPSNLSADQPNGFPTTGAPNPVNPPRAPSPGHVASSAGVPGEMPQLTQGGMGGNPQQIQLPWQAMPLPQGQMPPPMQELLNAHFAALGQQMGGQNMVIGLHPNLPIHHNHNGTWHQPLPLPQFQGLPPPNFQNVLAQQQQARAAAGYHGVGGVNPTQNINSNVMPHAQQETTSDLDHNVPARTMTPGTSSTIVREGQGANGSQWRVVINQSSTNLSPAFDGNQRSQTLTSRPEAPSDSISRNPVAAPPSSNEVQPPLTSEGIGTGQPTNPLLTSQSQRPNVSLAIIQQRLLHLERALDHGIVPNPNDISQVHYQLQSLTNQQAGLPANVTAPLAMQLHNMFPRIAHLQRQQIANNASHTAGIGGTNTMATNSATTTVYLLSSPNGPHALLVSPSGMYSTTVTSSAVTSPFNPITTHNSIAMIPNPTMAAINRPNERPTGLGQDPQAIQQQQPQQPDQVGDLARLLLPLGGHLWLLIRLFGFVYFFTSGGGWHRTTLLYISTALIFMAQIGVFRPLQQALWDPLRRHVEALVPLGGNNAEANAAGGDGRANGQGGSGDLPTPQQAADRLLRERAEQDASIIRRNVRRVERAMALFIASLVPGVGERHIAARDAAEATRQAVEREREEQARQGHEQDRLEQPGIAGEVPTGSEPSTNAEEGAVPVEEPAVHPQPLVEI